MADYTELYIDPVNGDNRNTGQGTSGTPAYEFVSGDYNATTNIFTCAGAPDLSGIAINSTIASIYADGDSSTNFLRYITAVNNTTKTITIGGGSVGTEPTTSTGNRTLRIGGAWAGPSGSNAFPFSLGTNWGGFASTTSQPRFRVNVRNNNGPIDMTVTFGSISGPLAIQGYTTTPGDGGRATFRGPASGAAITFLTISSQVELRDLEFTRNGTSGSSHGIVISGSRSAVVRCIFSDQYAAAIYGPTDFSIEECEIFNCNKSNNSSYGGILGGTGTIMMNRCFIHHNYQAGINNGFCAIYNSIFAENTLAGITPSTSSSSNVINNCDFYANPRGINLTSGALQALISNCNFVSCSTGAIYSSVSTIHSGPFIRTRNCGFGGGAYDNASDFSLYAGMIAERSNEVYYTTHPWADPDNGDFSLIDPAAIGTGIGNFLVTDTSNYSDSTTSYPNIGAVASPSSGSGYLPSMRGGFSN